MTNYIKREDAIRSIADHDEFKGERWIKEAWADYLIEDAKPADVVPIELVAEIFGVTEPCNFGLFGVSVDDFMYSECGDWCESNCDNVPAVECWKKFFKMWEERKNTWIK